MKELYTVYTRKADGEPVTNKGRFATPEQAQALANIIIDQRITDAALD